MALIVCPECSQTVSDRAAECIGCGYPISAAPYSNSTPRGLAVPPTVPDFDIPAHNGRDNGATSGWAEDAVEYSAVATSAAPLLAIYLIDVSHSMNEPLANAGGKTKIMVVKEAFQSILKVMMRRSMKGDVVAARYGISLLAYSDGVEDVYGGTLSIEDALNRPLPAFRTGMRTNTAAAFQSAYQILKDKLPHLGNSPAPMVCHLTDGGYNEGPDPRGIVAEIRKLRNNDGPVLVENIFVGDRLTNTPINDIKRWQGVMNVGDLASPYVRALYEMASPLPASYASELQKSGYSLKPGVQMLIPAESPDLVELAFAMSGATKTQ